MEYVVTAVALMPLLADAAAVVSTVRTTVQTVRWVGSWATWAVGRGSSSAPLDDVWLVVESDNAVETEIRLVGQ